MAGDRLSELEREDRGLRRDLESLRWEVGRARWDAAVGIALGGLALLAIVLRALLT